MNRLPSQAPGKRVKRLLMVLAVGLAAAGLVGEPATARSVMLVSSNNQVSPITDDLGFNWDVEARGGYVQHGSSLFNSAMVLQTTQGQSFQASDATAEGDHGLVMSNEFLGLKVTRRVHIDVEAGVARWVDSFTNETDAAVTADLQYSIRLSSQGQAVVSDQNRAVTDSLADGETGFAIVAHPQRNTPSALLAVRDDRSDIAPTINNQSNYRFYLVHQLVVEPGETRTLMHALAQRNLSNTPSDEELEKAFDPLLDTRPLRVFDAALRRTLVNWRVGALIGAFPEVWPMPEELAVTPESVDLFVTGNGTRLKGGLQWNALTMQTRFGPVTLEREQVAGLAGPQFDGHAPRVYLNDGQLFTGPLEADALHFALAGGTTIDLAPDRIDRLVMRERPREIDAPALVVTRHGERIAVTRDQPLNLTVATGWGERTLTWDELRYLAVNPSEEAPGYALHLVDGSALLCTLDGDTIELDTLSFGPQAFNVDEIEAIILPSRMDELDTPPTAAYLRLSGEQILTGHIDLPELALTTAAAVIPIPPGQLHELERVADDLTDPEAFAVTLFDGSVARGQLDDDTLPVRVGAETWDVPMEDVQTFSSPTPRVTERTRARLALLIRDLGDSDWATREQASDELAAAGLLAVPMLREALTQSRDAEVRQRVRDLLDQIR